MKKSDRIPDDGKPSKRRLRIFPIILIVITLVTGIILVDSNMRLVTTTYELSYQNLPDAFDGYRIVVLSDVHAAVFGEDNGGIVSRVRAASPDIIALTGDLIDGTGKLATDEQIVIAQALAARLLTVAPVYYITGNHDWDSNALRELLAVLEECGVKILRNRYTLLEAEGDTIVLAGTDDPNGPADMIKPDEFVGRIVESEGERFIVMLEHRNNNLRLYSDLGVELVLCGHAHGGIIRLPFTDGLLGPRRDFFPTYTSGVYTDGATNMVVSRGVGNHTGFPRFLNNPEVVVIELRTC